jgi:hypothetical protein
MYGNPPKAEQDEKGNFNVTQEPSKADETQAGTEGVARHEHERREMHHRHVTEHLALHHKHEIEHDHHEGDKKELHERHEDEYKHMHKKHEHEMKTLHDKHEKEGDGEPVHGAKGGVEMPEEGKKKAKEGKAGEKE